METKMITIPFDVERAKKIQAGEEPGKIVTREGCNVRIVCWDVRDNDFPIVAALTSLEDKNNESVLVFKEDGHSCHHENFKEDGFDLLLQVPEWTQFKDGDILAVSPKVVVIFNRFEECTDCCKTKFFVALNAESEKLYFPDREENHFGYREDIKGYANEEQKQQLIVALKASTDPRAKEYLKRFFGIEEKQEQKFEFLQPVLVRDGNGDSWRYGEFIFERAGVYYVNGGTGWYSCIPYNDQTKHLLGTTDNWEE